MPVKMLAAFLDDLLERQCLCHVDAEAAKAHRGNGVDAPSCPSIGLCVYVRSLASVSAVSLARMNFQGPWSTVGAAGGLNPFPPTMPLQTERTNIETTGVTTRALQPRRPAVSAMEQLVVEVTVPATRERALLELSKKRESFQELAPYLWHSFGVTAALLQEVVSVYALLVPPAPALSAPASNRVCNALALLQCVASHAETRSLFLQGTHPISSHISR